MLKQHKLHDMYAIFVWQVKLIGRLSKLDPHFCIIEPILRVGPLILKHLRNFADELINPIPTRIFK